MYILGIYNKQQTIVVHCIIGNILVLLCCVNLQRTDFVDMALFVW